MTTHPALAPHSAPDSGASPFTSPIGHPTMATNPLVTPSPLPHLPLPQSAQVPPTGWEQSETNSSQCRRPSLLHVCADGVDATFLKPTTARKRPQTLADTANQPNAKRTCGGQASITRPSELGPPNLSSPLFSAQCSPPASGSSTHLYWVLNNDRYVPQP